ncbi:MAG: oligosaccharide flippase family protein [Bacteroidales bacterium]|nr:oligosaccharide flippase family protein [Bacteroidales bacterium]
MSYINRLAGQTLVYGLGTIVPRFLHYLVLTFFYTRVFSESEYGIVTELYAFMVLFLVILTYGMETGFFRYSSSSPDRERVFATAFLSLLVTSLFFVVVANLFIGSFAQALRYENNRVYIRMFIFILAFDAIAAIPFARLRADNRPLRFSILKIINVLVTIVLVLFFLKIAPEMVKKGSVLPGWLYNPDLGVGYVFFCNMIASGFVVILLLPEILSIKRGFSYTLWKRLLAYSLPLLIGGLAGTINDALDKMILRRLTPEEDGLAVVGEYGASYKVAVLMSLFIQMFRFAVEPFFFEKSGHKDARESYAQVMKYFVIITLIIYLGINLYISIFQNIIDSKLRDALSIVPIVSMGYLLYGIFVNLSVWYKINDLTRYGAILTLGGALITVVINLAFVPVYGYKASAWAHVACYGSMVIASFFLGKRYYPVPYQTLRILFYLLIAILIVVFAANVNYPDMLTELSVNTILIIAFVIMVEKRDRILETITGRNIFNR